MKSQNKKWITSILAVACVASLGAATVGIVSSADDKTPATETTRSISEVFASSGTLETKSNTVAFTLANDENGYIKRDLALQWYEQNAETKAVSAKYFTTKFALETLDFDYSVIVELQTASSVASDDDRASNSIEFKVASGALTATVNGETAGTAKPITLGEDKVITLALGKEATTKFDEFTVSVNGVQLDNFENIGENYADYVNKDDTSLKFTAKTAVEGKKVGVLVQEINGQAFTNVSAENKITDTAAPVLVINEDITTLQLGTAYSTSTTFAYQKLDVLQSSVKEDKKYYQYNPADTEVEYKSLTTSNYFMDSTYYYNQAEGKFSKTAQEGYEQKSFFKVEGKEYISITFTLSDDAGKEYTYDMAWYAGNNAKGKPQTVGTNQVANEMEYLIIDDSNEGATYTFLKAGTGKNDLTVNEKDYQTLIDDYQARVNEAAKDSDVVAGGEIVLPSVEELITDDGGYRSLRFSISYKTEGSDSPASSTNLAFDQLELKINAEGKYAFKIFANDKAGNTMEYYDKDGKLVKVSTSNVWDIEDIPSFNFEVKDSDIKVKDTTAKDRKAEKILNQTYTLSGLTVLGASNQESNYALYRLNLANYDGATITTTALTNIKYEDLRAEAKTAIADGKVGKGEGKYANYFELYLDLYAKKVAEAINGDVAKVKACFERIDEYNSRITENDAEWELYNKYNWNATSKSFKTVEEGHYLILADFNEAELPLQRAVAYKVVLVESEADVIKGDSKFSAWVKNNVVSVILFGVAGLMLIAIIILLLVKPSDETLEDIDKAVEGEEKSKKKEKKEDKE